MPVNTIKEMIYSEARENRRRATALNNPITGINFDVNEQVKSSNILSIQDNMKDLEMIKSLDNLGGFNLKSSNFLPEIPASGLDKRQLPKRGGGDSLS